MLSLGIAACAQLRGHDTPPALPLCPHQPGHPPRGSDKAPSATERVPSRKVTAVFKHVGSPWSTTILAAVLQVNAGGRGGWQGGQAGPQGREERHVARGKPSQLSLPQTTSCQAVGNSAAANWSLKETPRRQGLARIQPSNYARAPSVTEKHLPRLSVLGEFICSEEPSAGETQLLIAYCLFHRAPSEDNSYLTLTARHLKPRGKRKKKTPQAHVYLLNKDEPKDNVRLDERLMRTYSYQKWPSLRSSHPVLSWVNEELAAQELPQGIRHPKAATCTVSARRLQSRACQAPARNRSSTHTLHQYDWAEKPRRAFSRAFYFKNWYDSRYLGSKCFAAFTVSTLTISSC